MSRPQVLVVDDEDELRQVVEDLLVKAGYRVLSAGNGREALDLLVMGKITPDLILLDLRMPVMDGWEFTGVLRCYRRLANVPIVITSTPGVRSHPKVDGVLAKPFTPRALIAEVEKHAPIDSSPPPPP